MITKEIRNLEKRKEMAFFQRKITTDLATAIEYDQEISAINRKLEQLKYKTMKTLKEELKENCGLNDSDFDRHETDLYVRKTDQVYNYLKYNYQFFTNIETFKSQIDGSIWLDIPFAAWSEKYVK